MTTEASRYTYVIKHDEDEGYFIGFCLEFPLLSADGLTVEQAYAAIEEVVFCAIQDSVTDGDSYPAPLSVDEVLAELHA